MATPITQSDLPFRNAFGNMKNDMDRTAAPAKLALEVMQLLQSKALEMKMAQAYREIAPEIERVRGKAAGVLLELGYDERTIGENHKTYNFHYLSVVAAGSNAQDAYSKRNGGLRANPCYGKPKLFCVERTQYFWYQPELELKPFFPQGARN